MEVKGRSTKGPRESVAPEAVSGPARDGASPESTPRLLCLAVAPDLDLMSELVIDTYFRSEFPFFDHIRPKICSAPHDPPTIYYSLLG